MKRLVNPRQRAGLLQILIILIVTAWCSSANATATDDFLMLDKTLLLDGSPLPASTDVSLRSDITREQLRGQLRTLGVRQGVRQAFGREMIRMGRAFGDLLSARSNNFSPLLLRAARSNDLRSLGRLSSVRSVVRGSLLRKSRQALSGRYQLGARSYFDGKRTRSELLSANFSIFDKTLVWSVSGDKSGNIFAMSNYTSPVPEPGSLLLLATGLLGLTRMGFSRCRTKR